jgi:hypothetical protein
MPIKPSPSQPDLDRIAPILWDGMTGQWGAEVFGVGEGAALAAALDAIAATSSEDACAAFLALPAGVCLQGALDLSGRTWVRALPAGLAIGESLILAGCVNLERIPGGILVGDGIDLRNCAKVSALPEGLGVVGDLCLAGCVSIRRLPPNLWVGGDLDLRGCARCCGDMPESLMVEGRVLTNDRPMGATMEEMSRNPWETA